MGGFTGETNGRSRVITVFYYLTRLIVLLSFTFSISAVAYLKKMKINRNCVFVNRNVVARRKYEERVLVCYRRPAENHPQ
jgi:Fe-S-cluster containining protein